MRNVAAETFDEAASAARHAPDEGKERARGIAAILFEDRRRQSNLCAKYANYARRALRRICNLESPYHRGLTPAPSITGV